MTNNTINVPRELLENIVLCSYEGEFELGTLAAECQTLLSAPSPAGVDGLEVVAWRIGFPNNAGYKVYEQRQPWAYEQYGVPSVIVYEVQELCRLSDAQAIIDGLRGEVEVMTQHANNYSRMFEECAEERDHQAQRIGKLEGLLREVRNGLSCENLHHKKSEQHAFDEPCKVLVRIDAAMSAGKEGE